MLDSRISDSSSDSDSSVPYELQSHNVTTADNETSQNDNEIIALSTAISNSDTSSNYPLKQFAADEDDETQLNTDNDENDAEEEDTRESWRYPRRNIYRVLITFFAFVLMGMNDAATGVCTVFIS